jgi:hypothetical protein
MMERKSGAAVRSSAWLGVRPRPRLTNSCSLELSVVPLIAEDSGQPATQIKPLEPATRSRSVVTLELKLCGVMVGCDAATPNVRTERQPPTGTVERTRQSRIAAQPRTEKRGGCSLQ